jgi:hypothetical protein
LHKTLHSRMLAGFKVLLGGKAGHYACEVISVVTEFMVGVARGKGRPPCV